MVGCGVVGWSVFSYVVVCCDVWCGGVWCVYFGSLENEKSIPALDVFEVKDLGTVDNLQEDR